MNIKNNFFKKILLTLSSTFIITLFYIFTQVFHFSEFFPYVAVTSLTGLLFGPYGALGASFIDFTRNFSSGPHLPAFMNTLTNFLFAFIPYKLWYSSFIDKHQNNLLRLNSVHNVVKFVFISFIISLIYLGIYTYIYNLGYADVPIFVMFFNVFNFSAVFGMIFIIFSRFFGSRFFGVSFYYPGKYSHYPEKLFKFLDKFKIKPQLANLILTLSIIYGISNSISNYFFNFNLCGVWGGLLLYVPLILFLFKDSPKSPYINQDDNFKWGHIKRFDASLIEKLIIMFLIFGLIIVFLCCVASYFGLLDNIFNLGADTSLLLYMDIIFLLFFIPALIFLWYIDKNITKPLEFISSLVKNYISNKEVYRKDDEIMNIYNDYLKQDNEVGNLSRSLIKMTDDLKEYIGEVRSLSSEKEKLKTELLIAKKIQMSFIPKNFESVKDKGVNIAGLMIPAKEVGGDFYDFFMVDDNHLAIVIGDVSDKGVPAALFMVVTKTLIQEYSYLLKKPDEIFNKVNNRLCVNNDEGMFVTGWMGILELDTGIFNFVNAGHEPPLAKLNNNYDWLKTKPGFVLGGLEDINYKVNQIKLDYGDKIILYTDGVTEANNSYSGFFGEEGLLKSVSKNDNLSVENRLNVIKNDIYDFTGGDEQFDDITLLIMEYTGKK